MQRRLLLLLTVFGFLPVGDSFGSAPPRTVRAATSSNGKFLVISTYDLGPQGLGGGQPILSNTFEISRREPFNNPRDRLSAPNSYYYVDFGWKILLPTGSGLVDPWPILSDDGLFLVLVSVTPATDSQPLLQVYGKQQERASLVCSLRRGDLFARKPNEPSMTVIWDSTPTWFSKGVFTFSADGKKLMFHDAEHGTAVIRLADGAVTRGTP